MSFKKVLILVGFVVLTGFYGLVLSRLFDKTYQPKSLNIEQKNGILYSENAFYYKFYLDLAKTENWRDKISEFRSYDRVLYPEKVNVINKYNIVPEIILARLYRGVNHFRTIDVFDFYIAGVIFSVALTAGLIFLLVMGISGSWLGGITAVLFLILSFPLSSRAIYYPALRENFGIPTLVFQILLLTRLIKTKDKFSFGLYFLGTMIHVLFWQFSQFTLFAELLVLLFLYFTGAIKKQVLKTIAWLNLGSLIFVFFMFMENTNLLKSLFFGLNLSIILIFILPLNRLQNKFLYKTLFLSLVILLVFIFSLTVGSIGGKEVSHVFEYFEFQLLNKQPDFHSMLYKCSGAFDRINWDFLRPLNESLLMPLTGLGLLGIGFLRVKRKPEYWLLASLAILYFCFGFVANRFVVLALPFLCVVIGLIFSDDFGKILFGKLVFLKKMIFVFSIMFLGINFWRLVGDFNQKMSVMSYGEKKADLEVIRWINESTENNAVFAGVMPMTSKIFLMSDRKIANNPYYEDVLNRKKTWELYRVYGRETEEIFVEYLHKNKVDYYILNNYQCNYRDIGGCVGEDLYELDDLNNKNPVLCRTMSKESKNMEKVFDNENYQIFRISK